MSVNTDDVGRFWVEFEAASTAFRMRYPKAAPVTIDRDRWTACFGADAELDVRELFDRLRSSRPEEQQAQILATLLAAHSTAREVAALRLGSWKQMSARLGLVLRRPRPEDVGITIDGQLTLAVVASTGAGLLSIGRQLLDDWGWSEADVLNRAIHNTYSAPVDVQLVGRLRTLHADVLALSGGPFITGALHDLEPSIGTLGLHGVLAMAIGDRGLLVAKPAATPNQAFDGDEIRRFEGLADTLVELAQFLGEGPPITAPDASAVILQCRTRGQLAIFRSGNARK